MSIIILNLNKINAFMKLKPLWNKFFKKLIKTNYGLNFHINALRLSRTFWKFFLKNMVSNQHIGRLLCYDKNVNHFYLLWDSFKHVQILYLKYKQKKLNILYTFSINKEFNKTINFFNWRFFKSTILLDVNMYINYQIIYIYFLLKNYSKNKETRLRRQNIRIYKRWL